MDQISSWDLWSKSRDDDDDDDDDNDVYDDCGQRFLRALFMSSGYGSFYIKITVPDTLPILFKMQVQYFIT